MGRSFQSESPSMMSVDSPDLRTAAEKYPILISAYYQSLIDSSNPESDPITRQCMPDPRELDDTLPDDGLGEEPQTPVPRLIHRYSDRAVLLTTNRCAVHCRFCFRKRFWKSGNSEADISKPELEEACSYLKSHSEVRELLVSGGDPLMLSRARLLDIFSRLADIENLKILRLCTRVPVTDPGRVNPELAAGLAIIPGLWMVTHFNHPREVTPESVRACSEFISRGIPVLNQTVLLAGINDRADILEELFSGLVSHRIKPHYLFHIDPVRGVKHFSTGVERGIKILRELRNRISSLATPVFAIDLPEGGGKVPLLPDYRRGEGFIAIDGRVLYYPDQSQKDGTYTEK